MWKYEFNYIEHLIRPKLEIISDQKIRIYSCKDEFFRLKLKIEDYDELIDKEKDLQKKKKQMLKNKWNEPQIQRWQFKCEKRMNTNN